MRILLSCFQSVGRDPLPGSDFWRTYFIGGLQEGGHEIVEIPGVDWALGHFYEPGTALDEWRGRTWEIVRSFVRQEQGRRKLDLFLTYLFPKQVEVSAIKEIQRMGIPCVNFFCDNARQFRRVPLEYRPFALHWIPEYEALPMYREARVAYIHAPMPCWIPARLRCVPITETEPPTFIGTADDLRRDLFSRAMHAGGDFLVRGRGWMEGSEHSPGRLPPARSLLKKVTNQIGFVRSHGLGALLRKIENRLHPLHPLPIRESNIRGAVSGPEYIRITREAVITIGINRVYTARSSNRHPIVYSRLRDIEAPMLGACYLTEWTKGLEELYELGAEIETYRTADELNLKLADLKRDPQRRSAMRNRAQRRALFEHSIAHTAACIRDKLGLCG
jgi:Glycosyl transferases group 1